MYMLRLDLNPKINYMLFKRATENQITHIRWKLKGLIWNFVNDMNAEAFRDEG